MKRFQIAWLLALAFLLAVAPTLFSEKSAFVKITGDEAEDHFGWNVSSAGDVNDDGYEDIIVGAPGYGGGKGRAYIFFGGPWLSGDLDTMEANVTINGSANGDKFSWDVSSAGDVNGDLISDVIIGAPGNDSNKGRAYIFFGKDPMPKFINATKADVILSGESEDDEFGFSVSSAGDVNYDDFDDVIVGAPGNDSNTGAAYIFLGNVSMVEEPSNIFCGFDIGDKFGFSVSTAGDINGDGYDDVIVGAPGADRAYIFYGGEPMNSWVQTSDADFNAAEDKDKVHVKILGDEVKLDTFYNTKAMMAYFNGSSGFEHIPKNRTWNQTSWTSETDANSQGLDPNYWFVIESGTVRKNEKILAVSNSTGGINVQVSNGISWSPILNLSDALFNADYRGFDVAYESLSGDAMIAYINNQNNSQAPEYRIWNGTEWSINRSAMPASSTEIYWIVLASNPKSNEILMVTLDSSSHIYAQVWDGNGWGNVQEIETNAAQTVYQCFDVVYESQSGYGFIGWADNINELYKRGWKGDWSESLEETWGTAGGNVRFIKLASEPNTNYILAAELDNAPQIKARVWDGNSWGSTEAFTPNVDDWRCFDVAWESKSDREGLIVYGVIDEAPHYRNVTNKTISNSDAQASDTNPGFGNPNWIVIKSDPQSDDIMMMCLIKDTGPGGDDIGVELWNGSGWEKGQNVELNSTRDIAQRFDLAYTDTSGYFTSARHDAVINSSWGRIFWNADLPIGTTLKLRTKTSADNKTWSNWSEWYENGDRITSPNGRWIQYQAWLETANVTLSPTLKEVMIELNRPDVTLNGTNGDDFSWSVSTLGNVNNDGYDDIIIGAPRNDNKGSSYVFLGEEWPSGTYLIADLDSNVTLLGENTGDMFGYSVSSAGNFSRDCYDDIVIGAPHANGNGTIYVFYGMENMPLTMNAIDANYTAIGENVTDEFGWSVSFTSVTGSPGNDYHRIMVAAPYFNNGTTADAGRVYLFEPTFQPDLHDDPMNAHYYTDIPDEKQIRLQGMRIGDVKSFELTLTNDGDITDSFNVSWDWPIGQHSPNWEAWAWDLTNGVNITSDLTGGYITPSLDEGEGIVLAVNISVSVSADYGDISTVILNAASTNNIVKKDAFRFEYQIWTVDYYLITETLGGSEMADQVMNVGNIKLGYVSAFNNTYGGYIGPLNCTWNVTGNTGGSEARTSDGNGTDEEFMAGTETGKVRWNAFNNSLGGSDSVNFTILPGPVDSIECSQWPSRTYSVGTSGHPFEVMGYDQYGNENWTWDTQWSNPGGNIIEGSDPYNVTYDTGTLAGNFYVNVSVNGVYNRTEIVLQPGLLSDFYLEVSSSSPTAGQSTTITLSAVDSYNNVNTTYSGNVDVSVNGATKSSEIVYSSGSSNINDNGDGTATLQASAWQNGTASFMVSYTLASDTVNFNIDDLMGTLNTTGDITWFPDEIDRISLNPSDPTWDVDLNPGPHTFTAEGYDQYDNPNTSWTPVWEATGGTVSGSGYTVTYNAEGEPGIFYVNVSAEGSSVKTSSEITLERHRPTITTPIPHQEKPEDYGAWELNLHDNASDPENDPDDLKWYITGEEAYDSIFYVTGEGNSTLTFHTVEDGYGNCEVMLWVHDTDGNRDGQVLWVNITPGNDAPFFDSKTPTYFIVHYDNPEFPEDDPQPYDFSMFLHDIDNDPSELILITSEPASSNQDGWIEVVGKELTFHYPYSKLDENISVVLTLSDGELSSEHMIRLHISSNWQPQKLKEIEDVHMNENSTLHDHFDLDDYFYDKDGDVIYFYIIDQDAFVNVSIDHENNTVDFFARPLSSNQIQIERVTFGARDPTGAWLSTTINVTIYPINDPPIILPLPKYFIVHYGKNWTFDLSPYVSDSDNEMSDLLVSIEQTEYLENNYVTIDGMVLTFNFPFTFVTPSLTLNVEYSVPITIKVTDGIATVSQERDVNVTVNNPPTLDEEIPDIQFYEDTNFTTEWTLNDYFSDTDTLDILYINPIKDIRLSISINNDLSSSDHGRITFTPQENWFGVVKITIRAVDNRGAFKEDTFLVRILPVNDPPVIRPIPTQIMGEGSSWVLELRNYISDVDNLFQELEISVSSDQGANVMVVGGFILFEYSEGIYNDTITLTVLDGTNSTQSIFYVELFKSKEQDVSLFASLEQMCFFPWSLFILIPLVLLALFYTRRHAAAAKAKKESVLEDAFLVYENGCLIAHHTRRLKPDYDHHIMTSMLTAIQSFVKDSFKDESEWDLKNISFGENQIVIERGKNFFLAAVYKGKFQEEFSEKMRRVIGDVEDKYGEELEAWNGDLDSLRGTKDLMEPLFLSPEEIEELRNNKKDNDITSTD